MECKKKEAEGAAGIDMELSVIIAKLAEGMFVSISNFYNDTGVFAAPWASGCLWKNVKECHSEKCSKGLYFYYAGNTADAAADDGIFRAVLFVSN